MQKIVAVIVNVIVVIMILISLGLCIGFGVKYKSPQYFFLLANILMSSVVTFVLLFWYYKGSMAQGLIWYIVLQCVFLFFQCVTTDVFATIAPTVIQTVAPPQTSHITISPTSATSSNSTTHTMEQTADFSSSYYVPVPTPTP